MIRVLTRPLRHFVKLTKVSLHQIGTLEAGKEIEVGRELKQRMRCDYIWKGLRKMVRVKVGAQSSYVLRSEVLQFSMKPPVTPKHLVN